MNSERAVESRKQPDFVAFIQRTLFLLGVVVIAWVLYSARQVVVTGLTAVVLAVFLADDPPLYRKAIVSVFPVSMRPRASLVLDACARGLWRWLLGQAFAMALICLFTTAGLYLIQMEHALTLGLIAELLQFIPYLGPYLSAIPAVMVAVTVSPGMVLWVTLLYLVVHLVESNLVTPFVFQNRANLPPAFTLFSTIVFGVVFGPLGVVVATPLSVLLLVLYEELYQKDVLGLDIRSAGAEGDIRARFKRGLEQGPVAGKANTRVAHGPQDR